MKTVLTLWQEVTDHYYELKRDGDDLILEPGPFSRKLSAGLITELKTHKPKLLSLLRFQEQADSLLLESTRRIAESWTQGFDLDEDLRWQQSEKELCIAYHSGDPEKLRVILELREKLAHKLFRAYRKQQIVEMGD